MAYYPIFLELARRPCLVIGGGQVAYRKAKTLLLCGARVTVVSPALGGAFRRLAEAGRVRWLRHPFRTKDLAGVELVVAATDDPPTNRKASREAKRQGIFINVVDCPRLCSFIVPSVVRRGKLVLAVSTGGVSPALAKWIRRDLQGRYGPEFRQLLKGMARVRGKVIGEISGVRRRKRLFEKALKAYFQVLNEG